MSVNIPQPFRTSVSVVQPFRTRVEGIPDTFNVNVDRLPVIHLAVDSLPTIHLRSDPIEIRLTELPSIRGHIPADFSIGLSVFGFELAAVRICGEAQLITEPYRPNPCEVCGPLEKLEFTPIDRGLDLEVTKASPG